MNKSEKKEKKGRNKRSHDGEVSVEKRRLYNRLIADRVAEADLGRHESLAMHFDALDDGGVAAADRTMARVVAPIARQRRLCSAVIVTFKM